MSVLLSGADEALDQVPTVTLNEEQLQLARVEEIEVGTEFTLTCTAVCTGYTVENDHLGYEDRKATFELTRLEMTGEAEQDSGPGDEDMS